MNLAHKLENVAETAANTRTTVRYTAREMLREFTQLRRVANCGTALGQEIRCSWAPGAGGVRGLATCGSVWACPVCASKVGHVRTGDLEDGITTWAARGGRFALLTLTMRHNSGHKLGQLWDGLTDAWRRYGKDGSAARARKRLGVRGYHRTTEVTYGINGWHVHLHVLYFLEGEDRQLESRALSGELVARWIASVEAAGFEAYADAQDWKVLRGNASALRAVAGYVLKAEYRERELRAPRTARQVALEVTRGDLKSARLSDSRTPFEILADISEALRVDGELLTDDLRLWAEWELGSKGRRQQVWSRGMRAELGLGQELTDEEAAELEVDGEDVVIIDADEWRRVTYAMPTLEGQLRVVLSSANSAEEARSAVSDFLTARGVRHRLAFPFS